MEHPIFSRHNEQYDNFLRLPIELIGETIKFLDKSSLYNLSITSYSNIHKIGKILSRHRNNHNKDEIDSIVLSQIWIDCLRLCKTSKIDSEIKENIYLLVNNSFNLRRILDNNLRFEIIEKNLSLLKEPNNLNIYYQYKSLYKTSKKLYRKGNVKPLAFVLLLYLIPFIISLGIFFVPYFSAKENREKTKAYVYPHFF